MNIGKLLRYYRKRNDLTQSELAEKAGINEKYYGELERNESSPTINTAEKICHALEITLVEFFSIEHEDYE